MRGRARGVAALPAVHVSPSRIVEAAAALDAARRSGIDRLIAAGIHEGAARAAMEWSGEVVVNRRLAGGTAVLMRCYPEAPYVLLVSEDVGAALDAKVPGE